MPRLVIIIGILTAATAAVSVWRSSRTDMHCDPTMDFNGVAYAVYEVTEEITAQDHLGIGIERGCGDNAPSRDTVAVSRIAGVNPSTAVVTPVAAHVLYVAEGVTIDELPSEIAEIVAQ